MSDIYFYNPTGEMAIANGNHSYMAPKLLRTFEKDLSFIPSFFAHKNDIIVCEEEPNVSFIQQWQNLGLQQLNYLNIEEACMVEEINNLHPWSWSPASHHYLRSLKPISGTSFKTSPNNEWTAAHKLFFSRESCNSVQTYIHKNNKTDEVAINTPAISIHSVEEVKQWITKNGNAVIKMPWNSSGRGVHTVDTENNKPLNVEWLTGAIKQQGFVTIEPLLNKVKDFSYQLKLDKNGGITFLGISHFTNDEKGHFTGGILNWPHSNNKVSDFFTEERIDASSKILIEAIKSIQPELLYEGHIGVDGIVYLDENLNYCIHPCLDINWRYNMGNINIMLPKYIHNTSIGTWQVGSFKKGEWNTFTEKEGIKKPLVISGSKIVSGFIALTPPSANAQFGVWMEVSERN